MDQDRAGGGGQAGGQHFWDRPDGDRRFFRVIAQESAGAKGARIMSDKLGLSDMTDTRPPATLRLPFYCPGVGWRNNLY